MQAERHAFCKLELDPVRGAIGELPQAQDRSIKIARARQVIADQHHDGEHEN
jgi:hypothetical protein